MLARIRGCRSGAAVVPKGGIDRDYWRQVKAHTVRMSDEDEIRYEETSSGLRIAYRAGGPGDTGGRCGFFWLGGLKSVMTGSKARALCELARETERCCLRFDYSGHGA